MNIPPQPSAEQLNQALTPATPKLSKRNLNISIRLLKGESIGTVAKAFGLSHERTAAVCLDACATLKQRLLSEEQRKEEFGSYEAVRVTDYRHPERVGWWLQVLQALVVHAPPNNSFMLDKRPSGINLFTRA